MQERRARAPWPWLPRARATASQVNGVASNMLVGPPPHKRERRSNFFTLPGGGGEEPPARWSQLQPHHHMEECLSESAPSRSTGSVQMSEKPPSPSLMTRAVTNGPPTVEKWSMPTASWAQTQSGILTLIRALPRDGNRCHQHAGHRCSRPHPGPKHPGDAMPMRSR